MTKVIVLLMGLLFASSAAATDVAHFEWFHYQGRDPSDSIVSGANDYRNPILKGFYSDPSIEQVGDDFYLVSSTFALFPGLPVFHSRDLVHWTQIGNAISRPDQINFRGVNLSRGLYAPDISQHDGVFYILNTCVECGGNFIITATNPAGPWSNPVWLPGIDGTNGYDPSLFFDADGSAWIVSNGPPRGKPRYDGHRAIWLQKFDIKTLSLIGPRSVVVDSGVHPETNPSWIEGPHLFKNSGRYYLIAAEGGTGERHSEVVFRSDKIIGPYLPAPQNPILTQRDLDKTRAMPVTSAGHADFVRTKAGWWSVFLATRPYADNFYNTGRETFLLPVKWEDGWPMIVKDRNQIPYVAKRPDFPPDHAGQPTSGAFHVYYDFKKPDLPIDFMMMRGPATRWWHTGPGLTLDARPDRLADLANPSFVGRRQQHQNMRVETKMLFQPKANGGKAGLVILQSDDFYYFVGIVRDGQRNFLRVERRAGSSDPKDGVVLASQMLTRSDREAVLLRIDALGPKVSFRYSFSGNKWHTLIADADNTLLSTATARSFIGDVVGLYATAP